ncbi:GAS2-like protein 2 isoform X2 [Hyperolius riggenbachi]|uniref:GAS2-like protein 2 isoform X2 n=1 Tax=Hyperolius riggenbachi TaxID=752182 RepID=UPI0035A2B85E
MSSYQGGAVRSIRPFKSSEQYLYAMKEDLAEWLKDLYNVEINIDNFFDVLENGSIICYHANNVTDVARDFAVEYPDLSKKLRLPKFGVTFNASAQPRTFMARDNVSNFIQWCRKEMDIKVLMFESEDLVLRKNEKNFILCLLELARRASRFGMSAPMLIQMEEQIEEEIREELELPPVEIPLPKPQRKLCDFKNLDQMVQHLVSRCTCPVQFSMIKVSEGKYKVGESNTLIFVRILRNHVMVRVGGGWDTLEHYLDKHDPCRCTSLSHKQMSTSGSRKPSFPVHEITARVTPRSDDPSKSQTTLIVSRSQTPLPPVDWRTYTANNSRTHSSSSSPESADKTPGFKTPQMSGDLKKSFALRGNERPVTPSRRQLFMEDGHSGQQFLFPPPGHNSLHLSISSAGSQPTGSEGEDSHSSDVFYDSRRGRQMKSPAPGFKEKMLKTQTTMEKDYAQQESRPKTPSRYLRSPSPSKHLLYTQPNKTAEYQAKSSTGISARPSSPTKQINARSTSPTKQLIRPPSPTKQFNTHAAPLAKQMHTRSVSPTKQLSQPITQELNGVRTMSTFNRPSTPSRGYQGESENRDRSKSIGSNSSMSHNNQAPTRSVSVYNEKVQTITMGRSTPTTHLNKNGLTQGKVSSYSMRMQNRQSSALEASIMTDSAESAYRYTPKPIGPDQEQELYQSLEDEIQSNIKALEDDSDENDKEENKSANFTSSIASDVAVHNFTMRKASVSSMPLMQNRLKTPDGEVEVPRSGVYINTKWNPGGGNYDDVITELSQGQLKLNKVDVENWISRIPPKPVLREAVQTDSAAQPPLPQQKLEPTFSVQTMDKTKTSFIDYKDNKVKQLPSQRARQLAMEAKKKSLESATDIQNSTPNCPKEETTSESKKFTEASKQKRSLKKPERVPSIYKLKLRPKIRPRRDNRPEKKPSKIPTPVSYLQGKKSKSTRSTSEIPMSARSQSESLSTALSTGETQSTAFSTGDQEDTDEAVSELSLSLEATGSSLKQSYDENDGSKCEEVEETWI